MILASSPSNGSILTYGMNKFNQNILDKFNILDLPSQRIKVEFNTSISNIKKHITVLKNQDNKKKKVNKHQTQPTWKKLKSQIFYTTSESMKEITSSTIQTIITSPPYWKMRDYGSKDQIGWDDDYETYCSRLASVWKECYRILKSSGHLFINIDTRMIRGDMKLLPVDFIKDAFSFGFEIKDVIIWHKTSSRAGLTLKNFCFNSEYILWLVKDWYKAYINPKFLQNQIDYDEISLINRKITNTWKISRKLGSITKEFHLIYPENFRPHKAIFPLELAKRVINLTSKPKYIILDPFMGSGMSAVAALKLKRKYFGYELNKEFKDLIETCLERSKNNKNALEYV